MIPRVLIRVPRVFVEYNESFLPCCGWNYSLLGAVTPTRRSPTVRWSLVFIPQAGFLAVGYIYQESILGWSLSPSGGNILLCVRRGFTALLCVLFPFFGLHYGLTICKSGRCGLFTCLGTGFEASVHQGSY